MQNPAAPTILDQALDTLAEMNPLPTDGKWLEELTVAVAPHLKEWDIAQAWRWADWPERETIFPDTDMGDIGIDVIARRRSDGQTIAIQCKARQLDAAGHGADIAKAEVDKFTAASVNAHFAERWLVTNGDNRISDNARQMAAMSGQERPIKLVNIHADILDQRQAAAAAEPDSPGQPDPQDETPPRQSKSAMQAEAVAESVRILQEHAAADDDDSGQPAGQARGKIILPCGAGKTRVSLRIVEQLTPPGSLAIVLCPSIALVAQIRREYLQHSAQNLRPLAVCSDQTAAGNPKGYNPKREESIDIAKDPTADNGNVSASEVKGQVTTDPAVIGQWIQAGQSAEAISVLFGTYQSGHRIAEALKATGTTARVLIADEAHRTAGLRRSSQAEQQQRRRDFTLCHDQDAFPATYRVYQTATPRIYDTRKVDFDKPGDWIVRSMDDQATFGVELYRKSYVEAVNNGWLADYRIIALGINDREAYAAANMLAQNTKSKGRRALTTHDYLRGLTFALAMGGATQHPDHGDIPIKSCIAFMNTVDKSKNMAADLASPHRPPVAAKVDGRQSQRAARRRLHPGTSGRHQQCGRPGQRQAEVGGRRRPGRRPPRHYQCRHFRRRHRFPLPQRRGLSGIPQKPHRCHSGRRPGYARRPGQGPGLYHLPHLHPAGQRPGNPPQPQRYGRGLVGIGPNPPGPARPRPAHRG